MTAVAARAPRYELARQREAFRVTGSIALACRGNWCVEEVAVNQADAMFALLRGIHVRPDTYTRLLHLNPAYTGVRKPGQGALWMSDTPDEYRGHAEAIRRAHGRVLLNGLGLGCVLRAMLANPAVTHVDVVERDAELVALMREVAPWVNDPRVHVHVADAFAQAKAWPRGTTWDVAWHDIWLHICTDDLAEHAKLQRSYARRVGWQGCWEHARLLAERRRWG